MASILIIDDDAHVCDLLSRAVRRMGHEPDSAQTLTEGLTRARAGDYGVVFLDVRMPDGNGLDYLPEIKKAPSQPEVIIITAVGDPDGAELAIANGAWDYMPKQTSLKEMSLTLLRALQFRAEKKSRRPLTALKRDGIIGRSPKLNVCLDLVAQAAASEAPVLIYGETGTGKEVFAQAIHVNGARAGQRLVVVDCAALPENLVESILFGHEKGSFTGADKSRAGVIKQADGGTLFLDEIGELPLNVQKAFLRVLQENRFRPVGGQAEVESNFRLIAATNKNLEQMVETAAFRQDLLFRIRSHIIELPPLREREGDIKELALYYLARLCERYGTEIKGVSPDFWEALLRYHWPGNVRELVNTVETTLAAAFDAPTLFATHLPTHIRARAARAAVKHPGAAVLPWEQALDPVTQFPPLSQAREAAVAEFERRYLRDLLRKSGGNVKQASRLAQVSRQRLHELLRKHQVRVSNLDDT
ncbi:MAG: sigma-54 dependent transcriptional regulator [Thermodesulfobacteriota bacterium]